MSDPNQISLPAKTMATLFEQAPSLQISTIICLLAESSSETQAAIKRAALKVLEDMREQMKAPGMSVMMRLFSGSMSDEEKAKFDYDAMIADLEKWEVGS